MEWNNRFHTPIVGVVSFGIGAAVGYFVQHKRTEDVRRKAAWVDEIFEEMTQQADEEIDNQMVLGFDETTEPTGVIAEDIRLTDILSPETVDILTTGVEDRLGVVTVFPEIVSEWDEETELSGRSPEEPYIIHRDEYFAQESGNTQKTLTYYAGDEILVDESDTPIYNYTVVVGELRFGHGSEDPNIVYIRNEKLNGEYEVIRDSGHYSVEVLGAELEHSFDGHNQGLRRFRNTD